MNNVSHVEGNTYLNPQIFLMFRNPQCSRCQDKQFSELSINTEHSTATGPRNRLKSSVICLFYTGEPSCSVWTMYIVTYRWPRCILMNHDNVFIKCFNVSRENSVFKWQGFVSEDMACGLKPWWLWLTLEAVLFQIVTFLTLSTFSVYVIEWEQSDFLN